MKVLLRLYPARWRRRYAREMAAHLDDTPVSLRAVMDLIAGATDAWLNPEETPRTKEDDMSTRQFRVNDDPVSARDGGRMAGISLVLCFVLTAIGVVLDKRFGDHIAFEALIYSSFFIAFTWAGRFGAFKPYSTPAATVLSALVSVAWYGFFYAILVVARIG